MSEALWRTPAQTPNHERTIALLRVAAPVPEPAD